LYFSYEPLGFGVGVLSLWAHQCLEQMELGHAALARAAPSDEAEDAAAASSLWGSAARVLDRLALAQSLDLHLAETARLFEAHARGEPAPVGSAAVKDALHHRVHASARGYLAHVLVSIPALKRPFLWKVALGKLLAEAGRDLLALAMTEAGRVPLPPATQGSGAAAPSQSCLSKLRSARDINAPLALSILCGGLDKRIEHHLFPRMPPNRLRQLAPRVRALCLEHGLPYQTANVGRSLWSVLRSRTWRRYAASPEAPPAVRSVLAGDMHRQAT
jgi:hypothetical protein